MSDQADVRVTVLIPVFNGKESVARAISCVTDQSLADLEIIVIDDASQDGTAAIVSEAAARDPRIRLIELEENVGPGGARTIGPRAARGDWVAILDADDWMHSTRLERLVALAERDGLDAIADNLALIDPGLGKVVGTAFPIGDGEIIDVSTERFLDNTRPGGRVNLGWMQPVVRRAFLTRNGIEWPGLRHAEDMVFQMRLLMAGAQLCLIGDALYQYTQRRGTGSGQVSKLSRTNRSIDEQQRALDLILEDRAFRDLSRPAKTRLRKMYGEIAATSHALDLRDNIQNQKILAAALSGAQALFRPLAFARCLVARYVVGGKLR